MLLAWGLGTVRRMPTDAVEEAQHVIHQYEVALAMPKAMHGGAGARDLALDALEEPALLALARCGLLIVESILDIATSLAVMANRR